MSPDQFVDALFAERSMPIVRASTEETAASAMDAAVDAGFKIVEFTMTTPNATGLITRFSKRANLVVGAGTVMTIDDARAAVDAGARFLVSPVVDIDVINEAARLGVAIIPGTHTPTEMWNAHRAGAQCVKLFPVAAGGPDTVRSILGPMPFLRIHPTNGVDASNAAAYIEAGAFSIGFVRALFDKQDVAEKRWQRITERGVRLRETVLAAKRPPTRSAN